MLTIKQQAQLVKEKAALIDALQNFISLDLMRDMGNPLITMDRDRFLHSCPEYIGFCQQAREVLRKVKG